MRNEAGELLVAVFPCDNLIEEVELRGALEALRLMGEHFPEQSLWFEDDVISLIQKLKAHCSSFEHSVLLQDARWMLTRMTVYYISHTLREVNQCAKRVTKWIQETGTPQMRALAEADAAGICFERL